MKKSHLFAISASMALLLASCNKPGSASSMPTPGSSTTEPESSLTKALNEFGTNYTATFKVFGEDEDDYHPTFLAGDDFYANRFYSQTTGFYKVEQDGGKYHSFEHYVEGQIDPDYGKYITLGGRKDLNDEELKAKLDLHTYFDESKFTEKEEYVYHSDEEDQIVGYLGLVNTTMGYYAFGFGTGGIDIVLDDDETLKCIKLYGFRENEDDLVDKNMLWATIEFSDVGVTEDKIMADYLADLKEMPTPTYDYLKQVGKDGHNLYEGLTFNFEDMAISSVIGEDKSIIGLTSSLSPYIAFETKETSKFGDVWEHYGQMVNFTATISSENGHTVLKDIKDVDYLDDYNFDTLAEIPDGEAYFYDYGDIEYGRNNNGIKLWLGGATYEGGTVSEQPGKEETVTLSYVFDGAKYTLPLVFSKDTCQDVRSCFVDLVNEGLKKGDVINVSDVMFRVIDGKQYAYISETASFEKGISLNDLCKIVADEDVPLYSANLGPEFFFDMEMPGDDGVSYQGLLAIVDIPVDKAGTMTSEYGKELNAAGYEKVAEATEEGTTVYQYQKGSIVVIFTSPEDMGTYAYYQFQLANLDKEIVPEEFTWSGTYILGFEGDELEMHLYDDCTGDFGGDEFTYEIDGVVIKFDYNGEHYTIGHNEDEDSFWGSYTKGDSDYEFDYIWKF